MKPDIEFQKTAKPARRDKFAEKNIIPLLHGIVICYLSAFAASFEAPCV